MQRCETVGVGGVDIRPEAQQERDLRGASLERPAPQRGGSGRIAGIHLQALLHEAAYQVIGEIREGEQGAALVPVPRIELVRRQQLLELLPRGAAQQLLDAVRKVHVSRHDPRPCEVLYEASVEPDDGSGSAVR